MKDIIEKKLLESAELKRLTAKTLLDEIDNISKIIIDSLKNSGKILLCGNGGSAADAQHISTELVHQFELKRRHTIPAVALNTNTSTLTAIGNDWGFDEIYSRQIESSAKSGDIVIGITTSGNSNNIIVALKKAKQMGATTIAFTGKTGGKIKEIADYTLMIPSENTARIQETHITVGHILCKLIEDEMVKHYDKK